MAGYVISAHGHVYNVVTMALLYMLSSGRLNLMLSEKIPVSSELGNMRLSIL